MFDNYKPEEIAGVDMFIADEKYLGKGVASLALKTFIKENVNGKYLVLVTDPLKINKKAILFFKPNGFKEILDNKNTYINELMLL